MNKISKFLPYLIFNFLLGLIICAVIAFFLPIKEDLLSPFIFSWRIRQALLLFVMYIPLMFISSILLGYTIIFGKYGPIKMNKRDPLMMKFVKVFFILLIIIAVLYFLASELLRPIMLEKQERDLQKTTTYREYKQLAKQAYDRKDFKQALAHIERAIIVWPTSEEALLLQETIKIACDDCDKEYEEEVIKHKTSEEIFKSEYTAEQALKTAEKSMLILDFYTAHYYAKMAAKSFENTNPLKQEAEILANKAWTEIQKGKTKYLEQPQIDHFQKKKLAYEEMEAGNFIEAYYSFMEINRALKKSNDDKKDPEIERFLKLSKENLLKNVFFTDELKNIPNFEPDKNIEFLIDPEEHIYMKIYAISRAKHKDKNFIYLKNTEIVKKLAGKRIWAIRIPFAKLKEINKDELLLQIKAVDRRKRNKELSPVLLRGSYPIKTTYNIKLPFGFSDFDLIEEASLGAENMRLTSLYYFISRAETYGFKRSAFIRELIFRLSKPLLLMILSLFSAIISWKFRLKPGKKFRKILILLSPLCFALAYVLLEMTKFLWKLQTAILVSLTPQFSAYILIAILIAVFVIITMRLSATSEK